MKRLSQIVICVFLLLTSRAFAQTAVPLGTSANFAVLGGSGVTNTGTSAIVGNVGVAPGTSITGFPPGVVTGGTIHNNDGAAIAAHSDLATAYGNAAGQMATQDLTGQNLGGLVLAPGVYHFSSSAQLTGTILLNGGGNPNAIFIFQIGTTLTTASASVVSLENGAQAANVFWQVGASATLGTDSSFIGNILALTSITATTSVNMAGRLLALNGAVTMDTITLTYPPGIGPGGLGFSATPAPSSFILVLIGLAAAMLYQTRARWLRRYTNS